MATQTSWRMRGDVMEACSCATTCPCNFGSDPTPLPCEVVIGWRIQDGNYGNTRLDGLSVVLYGRIPANVFLGNWTVGVYLDQRASQPQAQALGDIFAGNAGGWPAMLSSLIGNLLPPSRFRSSSRRSTANTVLRCRGCWKSARSVCPTPCRDSRLSTPRSAIWRYRSTQARPASVVPVR